MTRSADTETVTACCWAPNNELYTCGDDQAVLKWSMEGEPLGKVCQLDSYVTAMHWFPSIGGQPADMFVVSCTDGSVRLILKTGRQEKKVDACTAAVISVKWNYDGSTLVTAGEDGTVKTWSRSGMLRSGIATCSTCECVGVCARARVFTSVTFHQPSQCTRCAGVPTTN